MKAVIYTRYGSSAVLQYKDVEKPTPKDNEVLVQVAVASVNPLDWHSMRGAPFLVRTSEGLRKPKDPRLGVDLAGTVETVGSAVTQIRPGDAVFGRGNGAFAEFACAKETALALKPANLSFEAAAAVPIAALTALQGLRDKGHIQPGQQVLINGAAGGVGTFAVQLAKSFGAEVTGVCSTRNIALVRSLGADHVIDYTQDDFAKSGQRYDLILDVVANHGVAAYQRALRPQGRSIVIGFSSMAHMAQVLTLGSWASRAGKQHISFMSATPTHDDLLFLKDLLEAGKVVPVIDRQYPLSELAQAIDYLEEGHAQGKVVITVA